MSDGEDRGAPTQVSGGALLPCDVVMAGGVTSGIIYPGAVAMIARRFSFRSIGGTSVGAIAAAATAGAEYGRRTGSNPHGFDQIAAIPDSLGKAAPDGHARLFHLFTPETTTKPLFALLAPLLGRRGALSKLASILGVLLSTWRIAVPAIVVAVAGFVPVWRLASEGHVASALAAACTWGALVVVVLTLLSVAVLWRRWLPAWRANGYGICTGNASPAITPKAGQAAYEGLTPWMHGVIQRAAGRTPEQIPLTFGDLWTAPTEVGGAATLADPGAPRAIDLAMTTSDISRNRTAQLPFLETPSPLYVSVNTLRRYFPEAVVDWMIEHQGEYEQRIERRDGVIRLPRPQNLPVVFGTRLSLSFPILLSAVPLLTPDFAKGKHNDGVIPLRQVWFSDGGLTSNFPIHFFDSPIPARPTFCLDLVDFDAEAPEAETIDAEAGLPEDAAPAVARPGVQTKPITQQHAPERTAKNRPEVPTKDDPKPGDTVWGFVLMTRGNSFAPVPFTAFDAGAGIGLASFLKTLVNTARFWSDNQLLVAPGVRDRVVHIALRNDEGGLDLDMNAKVIADLDLRGRAAGLLISARFDPSAATDPETGEPNCQIFANHRWVRYRIFMAAFEDLTRRFAAARRASDAAAAGRGESLLDTMIDGQGPEKLGYPAPPRAQAYYRDTTDDLEQLALKMADRHRQEPRATFDRPRRFGSGEPKAPAGAAPRPKMRIRLRPLVDNDPRAENADLPERS